MSDPPRMLTGPRIQVVVLGLLAAGLAVGGFQVGSAQRGRRGDEQADRGDAG